MLFLSCAKDSFPVLDHVSLPLLFNYLNRLGREPRDAGMSKKTGRYTLQLAKRSSRDVFDWLAVGVNVLQALAYLVAVVAMPGWCVRNDRLPVTEAVALVLGGAILATGSIYITVMARRLRGRRVRASKKASRRA